MAKAKAATTPETDDDLLGGKPADSMADDLLGEAPAVKKAKSKSTSKPKAEAAAPAKKAAKPKAEKAEAVAAPAKKVAKPKAPKAEVTERSARGSGAFFIDPEEKAALAKRIFGSKKTASTKEIAERLNVETWKVRRAIAEVLVPEGKAEFVKVGNSMQYTGIVA